MKIAIFTAVLLAILSPGVTQQGISRANVQQSLGFEDQASTSLTGWHASPPGSVSADDHITHSGHWAVRLQPDAPSGGVSVITRSLPVDFQGGMVELRGYLRLQDVSGSVHLWMRQDADGQMVAFQNMQGQPIVKGTHDWTQYSIAMPINPQAQQLSLGVLASGTGTVWADDLELLVDGKPIADAPAMVVLPGLPADHEFNSGSHIAIDSLTPAQVANLVTLTRVWGFLKYHHPAITAGQRHWDYELFRILPAVLAAPDRDQANNILLSWIATLGPIQACSPCVSASTGDLAIKPPLSWIHDRSLLGGPLSERLESIYSNRTGKQFYASIVTDIGNPSFDYELAYSQISFPDSGYQLLALFRWWNILQYWAPYRDVAEEDWPAVLAEFLPKFALAKDKTAYQLALFELIAKANDTHANLWSSLALRPPVGRCALPVTLRFIDDKPAVYRVSSNDSSFQTGDVLDRLDGTLVQSLVDKWAEYYADSNDAARRRDLADNLTRGDCGPVSVQITRGGQTMQIQGTRTRTEQSVIAHDQPGETFCLLSPDVAYLKISDVKAADLSTYFEKAKNTKGLIVDARNYPTERLQFAMGAYLAIEPTRFASFTSPLLATPGAFQFGEDVLVKPGAVHYGGRVIILVDETTQSAAEYLTMALRAMPNSTVVGSTTAGADGTVSSIPLPGQMRTMISGLGVYYPDHRPTQRIGIVPDVVVRPTIEGIAADRDEVLEKGLHIIQASR